MAKVLVIIPAFNEEEALPSVLKEIAELDVHCDVLVVDDGSSDRTAEVAAANGAMVAELPFNLGVGGALRAGFRFAVQNDYDRAVQVDGDGQHDPSQIPLLLKRIDEGADMVVGSRFAKAKGDYQVGRVRWRAMKLLRIVLKGLSGRDFSDTSSGFRAFNATAIGYFAGSYPAEYLTDTVEALLLACYAGLHVVEVGVNMRKRGGGLPSTRSYKLVYHYLRVMLILLTSASFKARRNASSP